MGREKNPKEYIGKTRIKPRLATLTPPTVYDLESRLFSDMHKNRKEAGLSLYGERV